MGDERLTTNDLDAIESLDAVLSAAEIDYWLFGGWAVDFWVGRVTRPHDDIDAAAWRRDYQAIRDALTTNGWRHTPTDEDAVGTRYTLDEALVEFTFLESGEAAEVVIPIPEGPVTWTTESLGDVRRSLDGVTARVIPLGLLRGGKATPRPDANNGTKDRADFEALEEVRSYSG